MIESILGECARSDIDIGAYLPPSFRVLPLRYMRASSAAVQMGSRREGRAVWALFASQQVTPALVVKVDHNARYSGRLVAEHEALTALERRADLAGTVPRPVGMVRRKRRVIVVQTGLPGRPLNVVLRQRARTSARTSARDDEVLFDWLFLLQNRPPVAFATIQPDTVVQRVATALGEPTDRQRAFLKHVEHSGTAIGPLTLPLLPGHGDLGTTNCLLDRGALRVIDWEGGAQPRTPIVDAVLLLNHYARALPSGHQPPNRLDAFHQAFLRENWLGEVTARSFRRHLRRLGVANGVEEYMFVAMLADLATGHAPTAHGDATVAYWTLLLRSYANRFSESVFAA
ncbi:MAG: aminoglycoside phosphotransferase family protein [Actinomycetota bacterium]|nr:aminoglycoside phosphotransferase family protein [Actinomycetota bacterium]